MRGFRSQPVCGGASGSLPGAGCGLPFESDIDIYRCVDCDMPLHRTCAARHFGRERRRLVDALRPFAIKTTSAQRRREYVSVRLLVADLDAARAALSSEDATRPTGDKE